MNPLSFIATIVLAITIIEGIYILLIDYKIEANRLFFFICLSISIWLLGGAFGYSATTKEEAFFWLKVSSPGFIFMHPLVLHFSLRYTKVLKSKFIYLIYIPSFIFLYISIFDKLVFSDIYRSGKYWIMVPDYNSITFYLLITNYLSYYLLSLVMLYRNIKQTKSLRIRSQSRIIFAAVILTITSYNVEPFLAPMFFNYNTYGQAPLYSIVWISLIWHAINKYRFLGIYNQFLPFDFIDSLDEIIVVIDCNNKIIKTNRALKNRLHASENVAVLSDLFVEEGLLQRLLDSVEEKGIHDITLNLITSKEETRLVKASLSVFKERFGDTVGYIISAREIQEKFSLLKQKGITEREYQLIQLILAGNSNRDIATMLEISLRTVETHITNIFSKLTLNKRSELVNYCAELFPHSLDS